MPWYARLFGPLRCQLRGATRPMAAACSGAHESEAAKLGLAQGFTLVTASLALARSPHQAFRVQDQHTLIEYLNPAAAREIG